MEENPSLDSKQDTSANLATQKVAFYFDPRDLVPEPLFCCDIEGWILWLNRAAEQLLGRAAHELIGNTFAQLFPPEDRSRSALHLVRQHWRGVTESYWETTLVSASGRPHWVGLRLRLLRASNGSMVYVCSAHDLQAVHTELDELRHKLQAMTARADEAAAAAELKSDFLATTSQELRIPMSGVISMSRLLLESELDRDQRMFVEVIQGSSESLLGLVDDVLDYSRIEAAKLDLQDIHFDLRVATDLVAATLASRAAAKGLTFAFGVHHRVPSLLTGDPGRMRQVVTSLGSNTIRLAESGEVSLRVELAEETAHGVTVKFWLRANQGDTEGKSARLLRAFADDDVSLVRQFGSTGLGLSISRRLVGLMGGRVGASCDPDRGIAVWIDLPFAKQAERTESAPGGAVGLDGLRVLVIGSAPAMRTAVVETLTTLRCRCTESEDADHGLDSLREAARAGTPYRLVFVDYDPSGFDPGALARSVREDQTLESSNLILTTVVGRQGDAAQAEGWGYAAYLVMPLKREPLREVMEEILRRSTLGQGASESVSSSLVTKYTVAEQRRQRLRVLLVEDDPVDQLVASAAMRRMGYEPTVVKSGGDALAAVRLQPFDVIFLDIVMPDLDGWEVASIIRREEPEGFRTPIIATTALHTEELRARCRRAGMDDVLHKPLDFDAMAAVIERLANGSMEGNRSAEPTTTEAATGSEARPDSLRAADLDHVEDAVPVLDMSRLEMSSGGNEELKSLLISAFFTHTRPPMERLEKAIPGGDVAAAEFESHKLRGMCASVGAARCAVLFGRLEGEARDGSLEHGQLFFRRAQEELAGVNDELRKIRRAA